ncbi:MAG: DUF3866 family protein [Angustibacter sp.]
MASAVTWRTGVVHSIGREWHGVRELTITLATADSGPSESPAASTHGRCRAIAYPALVGTPEPGDQVLITSGPLDRGLGTGGFAVVVAVPDRLPPPPTGAIVDTGDDQALDSRALDSRALDSRALDDETPDKKPTTGHLVKARYTPLQVMVHGADEPGSPHHQVLQDADDLGAMPVVVADLHSALPAVVAGIRSVRPQARVAYVMTDGGALPAWLSRTVDILRSNGWLAGCVSTGQAFGGDLEAVSVHSGLLAARLIWDADVAVVAQGPGNLGTGTRWGFSGVAAGEAINAVSALGGRPVAALRVSGVDPRSRHRGVSHHSLTAYGRVALTPADVVVPLLPGELGRTVRDQAATLATPRGLHRLIEVKLDGLDTALRRCPAPLSTMGRGLDDDPAAFLSPAVAGVHAGRLLGNTAT